MADTWYWTDTGIKNGLDRLTGQGMPDVPGGGVLRLYKNNPSPAPSKGSSLGDFTQCDFPGYAGVTLASSTWAAASVGSNVASSTYGAAVAFTRSSTGAPQTVYGAYLTNAANTELWGCCLFAGGPYSITNSGEKVNVTPTWTTESEN